MGESKLQNLALTKGVQNFKTNFHSKGYLSGFSSADDFLFAMKWQTIPQKSDYI